MIWYIIIGVVIILGIVFYISSKKGGNKKDSNEGEQFGGEKPENLPSQGDDTAGDSGNQGESSEKNL